MKIGLRMKRILEQRRNKRRLREYYISRTEKPPSSQVFMNTFVFIAAALIVLWLSSNYRQVLLLLAVVYSMLLYGMVIRRRHGFARLEKECRMTTEEQEYKKRLEQAEQNEVLAMLKEGLMKKFPFVCLEIKDEHLEGFSRGEKMAVFYFPMAEEETLETRCVLNLLKDFRGQGFKQIRIFCGGTFSERAGELGERYELNLGLYTGRQLAKVLRGTGLYPTESETENLIKRESIKRQRKLDLIKKQALQESKPGTYLIYSLVLFMLAWIKIGPVYWNLFFGLLLLVLAMVTLIQRLRKKKEELIF